MAVTANPGLHVGRLLSVDHLVYRPEERRELARQHAALAESERKVDSRSALERRAIERALEVHSDDIAIVRGSLATPQIAVVDYNDVVKGRAPDVRLEPGDIIYVPNSPYTQLKRYVNLILNSFVVTIAANEGTRAGGGTANVGVSVPVN
mgnify:CR=1 FL=1